ATETGRRHATATRFLSYQKSGRSYLFAGIRRLRPCKVSGLNRTKMFRDLCASAFRRLQGGAAHDSLFSIFDLEGIMALRRMWQEVLRFGATAWRATSLDQLLALIDVAPAERALARLYPSAMGEKAWPPLAMFKALLLATWYNLSDVALAEALSDRASFRRFCGFACDEETPERTAFVGFRRLLVAYGLDQSLFAAIARDLERKGACVRKGTLIDATIIASASKGDGEAAWAKHKSRGPSHGYKAHIAADKDTGIIRKVETTPANK